MTNKSKFVLNIDKDMDQYNNVISTCSMVDIDFPSDYLTNQNSFEAYVLVTSMNENQTLELPEDRRKEYDKIRKNLYSKIETTDISRTFASHYKEDIGYREVTAGLIDIPFNDFLNTFEPALDWGKNLVGYSGGELVVDEKDSDGQVVLLRERMVLANPWYILGAPVADMSKYEKMQYEEDSVKVNWRVTKSADHTVFFDFGYVLFKRYFSEEGGKKQEQTLVFFNSLLKTTTGYMEKLLPKSMQIPIILKIMTYMFTGYIKNYRKIVLEK